MIVSLLSSARATSALALLSAFTLCDCSSDKEPAPRSREQFCQEWANAACSPEVVSACQAATVESCRLTQQRECQMLVPSTFSDKHGDECLRAVADAYADADLTGAELITVLQLGGPCAGIVRGPKTRGESCVQDRDCDQSEGYRCLMRGEETGSCQIPEVIAPGQRCEAPQQTCQSEYYCDGKNCIAIKDEGDPCAADAECGEEARCSDGQCTPLLAIGAACVANGECASRLCYTVNDRSTCANRIRLSPAETQCEKLR